MAGFEDLEDDIELPFEADLKPQEQPRKLSRLQKARNVGTPKLKGLDTPEGEARSFLPEADLNEDEASSEDEEEEEGEGGEPAGEDEEEVRGEAPIAPIWDEEDEIEQYFKERAERGKDMGEESEGSGSDSDSEGEEDGDKEAPQLGDNPTLEDLQAETQRIMREVAGKDRLGKGQKIEIKPLTGIVAKLKERRALAIARAPKASFTAAPTFEDALAAATDVALPLPASPRPLAVARSGEEEETNPFAAAADAAEAAAAAAKAAATGGGGAHQEAVEEELDDDLEVLSDDEDGQFNVVPLPQRAPQVSPHTFNPFANTRDMDEFEDEPLVDDGLNSEDDSDTESERSWEVRKEEEEEGGDAGGKNDKKENKKKKAKGGREGGEGVEVSSDAATGEDGDGDAAASLGDGDDAMEVQGAEKREGAAANPVVAAAKVPPSAAALALAASDAVPEHIQKAQRKYLDMEAELSDEEGGGAGVSDDEEENVLDDNGELADLITHDKMRAKDAEAAGELHVQWQRQKDAQDLQEVMRGVKNGFRRRNAFGLDDGDEERNGRWRRARADGEDDDFMGLPSAGFEFPRGFQDGDDEPCEDEAMLQKAQQQRLLAGSQVTGGLSPGSVPLDEDSQIVLGLLVRGGSVPLALARPGAPARKYSSSKTTHSSRVASRPP